MAALVETPRGHRLGVNISGVSKSTSLPVGWMGKYTSLVPRRQIAADVSFALPFQVRVTPQVRFRGNPSADSYTLADLRTSWEHTSWRWRLDVTNIFDQPYEEIPGVPMPGRLVSSSLSWSF